MDDKLKKSQTDMTFQMKVLLYRNKQFLVNHRHHVQQDARREAELKTKKLLDLSAKLRNEDEIDDELSAMIDEYVHVVPDTESTS